MPARAEQSPRPMPTHRPDGGFSSVDNPGRREFLKGALRTTAAFFAPGVIGSIAACAPQAVQGGQGSEVSFPLVTKAESTSTPGASPTTEAKPTAEPTATAPEVLPQYKIAEEIGVPSREPIEGYVKFTREVTEPRGEVLYFPPDSLIGQYAGLDLRTAVPNYSIETLFSVRDGLISRALEAQASLSTGKIEVARDQLTALKKRIEFTSRGDKADTKATQGKIRNLDENGDGISDYLEPYYNGVTQQLDKVQSLFK